MMNRSPWRGACLVAALAVAGCPVSSSASASVAASAGMPRRPHAPAAEEFEAASRAEAAALATVTAARAERERAQARVQQLDRDLASAGARARQAAANVVIVEAAQRRGEVTLVETRIRLASAIARSRRSAAQMYRSVGATPPPVLGALTREGSLGDLASRQLYLEQAGERNAKTLTDVKIARADVADSLRTLRRQRRDAADIATAARAEQERLNGVRAEQERALAVAAAREQREQVVLASIQARKAEFERAAQRQLAASAAIEQALTARPSRGSASRHFEFPADGPISSLFGWRVHPIFGTRRLHSGIDIGASYGSPVRAGASGTVAVAGVISGYGNAIVIDHGGGMATLYGHLSRFKVRVGQTVSGGATIGAVGNTGNSTGPHLHFEVRVQGVPVDPMPYL